VTREDPDCRWFQTAFGSSYLEIYGHRDEVEAEAAVELLLERFEVPEGAGPVLDIGCGAGRHLEALHHRGFRAVGLDLSQDLLRRAESRVAGGVVRADMRRLPFREGVFGAAISMFTSFGYFPDPGENGEVLREAHRVTVPGGGLAIDYFNREVVLAALVPESVRVAGGCRILERRRVRPGPGGTDWIVKNVEIYREGRPMEAWREEVAAFAPADLRRLVEAAGFEITACLGNYDGSPFDAGSSPRCLFLARRGSR
jgi:SAM-dependent methyltransferase